MFPFIDYVNKIYANGKNIRTNSYDYNYIPFPIDSIFKMKNAVFSMDQFEESLDTSIGYWNYRGRK